MSVHFPSSPMPGKPRHVNFQFLTMLGLPRHVHFSFKAPAHLGHNCSCVPVTSTTSETHGVLNPQMHHSSRVLHQIEVKARVRDPAMNKAMWQLLVVAGAAQGFSVQLTFTSHVPVGVLLLTGFLPLKRRGGSRLRGCCKRRSLRLRLRGCCCRCLLCLRGC